MTFAKNKAKTLKTFTMVVLLQDSPGLLVDLHLTIRLAETQPRKPSRTFLQMSGKPRPLGCLPHGLPSGLSQFPSHPELQSLDSQSSLEQGKTNAHAALGLARIKSANILY